MTLRGILLAGAALAILSTPQIGQGQEKKKSFVPDAQPAVPKTAATRPSSKRVAPALGSERFVRKSNKELAEAKWNEAFKLLKRLIKQTRDDDPAKPDLLNRLSEMYWERASAIDIKAFDEEETCLQVAKTTDAEEACVDRRVRLTDSSQQFRDKAIDVYKYIVQNFPQYPRLDGVLFALGFNFQRKAKPEAAKKIYKTLIRKFPQSVHIPDTLLNFGELLFEEGLVDPARKAYEKVVTNYSDASVYGYARYKLGWCNYNLGRYKQALTDFIDVLKYSRRLKGKKAKNKITLEREALKDLVRTYINIPDASPKKAIPFFRKVSPDGYLELAEKTAQTYSDTGQFEKSNQLYRQLIKQNRKSYSVVAYQKAITDNTRNIGQQVKAVQELKRLVSLWAKVKGASDADPKRVRKDRTGIEELLRSMAVTYHRQALKTKSDQDFAVAYELYKDYVETFEGDDNAYTMNFYYAELLYKLEKWRDAARRYESVVQVNSAGEFTRDAAHGAVLAYKKLLNIKQDSKGTNPDSVISKAMPEAKELPEDHARYITACDVYAKYVQDSQYLVDIEYDAARIYYDFNQFDKAIPRFKNIAEKNANHRLAIYAANLLLDSHNLRKDFEALNAQVEVFLTLYSRERDPEFHDLLIKLKQQATFKRCSGLEGKKKRVEAARCFLSYARDFPESEYADKSLYNAAFNYQQERLIEKSIQALLVLVNKSSESELVPKALFQIGKNLQDLAIFSKASEAYEYYAKQFPKEKNAKEALQNAAFFRMGLGQLDKAIVDYQGYMKLVSRKDKKKASEVFFSIGGIYQKRKEWNKVIRHYGKFLRNYGKVAKPDLIIEAHARIGDAYYQQAQPAIAGTRKDWRKFDKFNKPAQKAYGRAYAIFQKMNAKQKGALTSGVAAAAEARFRMAENIFLRFRYRTRLQGKSYRNVKKFISTMTKKIKARTEVALSALTLYEEVIALKSPNWAIASLTRIGEMFQQLSNDIYDYPAPKSFDDEQVEAFKGAMTDQAEAPRTKAITTYVRCLQTALKLKWFNEWSDLAERRLAEIAPGKYRYNAESRTSPIHFSFAGVEQGFITELKKEEK